MTDDIAKNDEWVRNKGKCKEQGKNYVDQAAMATETLVNEIAMLIKTY